MPKAFQSNAFQNDTAHAIKAFQVEASVAVDGPTPVVYFAMRGMNPEYQSRNPDYRGINVGHIDRGVQYDGKGVDYRAR